MTRTEINKFVNDLVNLDRVRSLLKTIYHRRRFRAYLEEKRRQQMFDQGEKIYYYFLLYLLCPFPFPSEGRVKCEREKNEMKTSCRKEFWLG